MSSVKIDRVSFNKKEVEGLGFKEFKDSFAHLLDSTPIEVAYKLATGQNPPKKKGYVRKDEESAKQGEKPEL